MLSKTIDQRLRETYPIATAEDWRRAIAAVVTAVVVLRTIVARAFDTELAGLGYATGFIFDKSRGIILTNCHVVYPGPNVVEATFVNREEILAFSAADIFRMKSAIIMEEILLEKHVKLVDCPTVNQKQRLNFFHLEVKMMISGRLMLYWLLRLQFIVIKITP